ncbi:UNVERIFIED_CONTAM: hypothetical protein Q9R58_11725 [Methylobacteriaceae bacterium AG10]|nr:hypothetical protein [Methylobacteriaceae bacterium AG10]
MFSRTTFAALFLALGVSACATVAPNTLSPQETADLRFTSLEVQVPPEASIRWSSAEDDYLRSRGLSLTDPALVATPEARAYLRDLVARRLKHALERVIARRPEGSRPVRLVATIKRVDIPSAAQRILIGGYPMVQADIAVIDARSGALLTTYKGAVGMGPAGQGAMMTAVDSLMVSAGADDLFDRTANGYAEGFRDWLAPR